MNSDLIGRLEAIRDLWESPDDPPEWGQTITEAIAALSPVLPDEVEQFLGDLQSDVYTCPTVPEIVKFIERLARERNQQSDNASGLFDGCKVLQQRIEEHRADDPTGQE